MKFFWYLLIFFFLFRFLARFLLPVFKITRQASQHMRHMQQQMNEMQQRQQQPPPPPKAAPRQVDGTYIDYEEVK